MNRNYLVITPVICILLCTLSWYAGFRSSALSSSEREPEERDAAGSAPQLSVKPVEGQFEFEGWEDAQKKMQAVIIQGTGASPEEAEKITAGLMNDARKLFPDGLPAPTGIPVKVSETTEVVPLR